MNQCIQKAERLEELYEAHVPKKPRNIEKALRWASNSLQRTVSFLRREEVPAPAEEERPVPSACKDWSKPDYEEANNLITFAQKVSPENQQLFLQAYELVSPLARQVQRVYEEQGVLSFDDLIIKTRNLLQHNLYVRRVLKEKFDALFIDEFQDTDPVQGEMLLFLAEEKSDAASRWQDVRLLPGKLFVVGDPKQSIYRFRGADITAYELFTDLILKQGGEKCFLQNNFRSEPGIIEAANEVCSRAMVQQSAFQPAYVPIFTDKPVRGPVVEWLFVTAPEKEKPAADDYRHNQAEQIARWIDEQVGSMTLKDGRKLAYGDIALLTRVGTTSRIYTDALRRYGIPFNTETDKDFFHKQEINDLILFLRAAADPEDKIALAGVLRSPFGGLSDEELYQVTCEGNLSLTHLLNHPKTASCALQIKHFNQLVGRVSLQEWLEKVLTETFLPESCAAAYDQERSLAYLHQLTALVQNYEAENGGSLTGFLSYLETQVTESPDALNLPPADETEDAVSLLTVHKSKGLEFPVVILADLSRKETVAAAHPVEYLFSWQYNMYGLRVGKICDVNLAFLEEEQKKHSRCEEVRVLYVALTRAKEKLILVADSRSGAEKGAAPFVAANMWPDGQTKQLDVLNPALPVQYYGYVPPREFLYQQVQRQTPLQEPLVGLSSWHRAYEARRQSYTALLTSAQKQTPSELSGSKLLSPEQQRGAELGTVCHRALELIVSGTVSEVTEACKQSAQSAGAADRVAEAVVLLRPFTKSDLFKEITSHKLLACEMPFSVVLADGTTQNGVMDAVLQTPTEIWVIDYKTDQVTPGTEEVLFAQKYRAQLAEYRRAVEQIFPGEPVRVSAVFIRTFAVVEG